MNVKTNYSNYEIDRLVTWTRDKKTSIENAISELRLVETLLSYYPNKPILVEYNISNFQKIDVSNYMIVINNGTQKIIQIKGDTTLDKQKNIALVSNAVILEAKKISAPYVDTVGFGKFQFRFEMMENNPTDDRVFLRNKIKTAGEAGYLWNRLQQKVTSIELLLATALDYIWREQTKSSQSILPPRDEPIVIENLFTKINLIPNYIVFPEDPWVNLENEFDIAFETQIKKGKKKKVVKTGKVKKKNILPQQTSEDTVMFKATENTEVTPPRLTRTIEIPQRPLRTDSFSSFVNSLELSPRQINTFDMVESPTRFSPFFTTDDQDFETTRKLDFNNFDSFEFPDFN